jgi:sulfur relay (sulfurtransferase) DsrF/TusC family protein
VLPLSLSVRRTALSVAYTTKDENNKNNDFFIGDGLFRPFLHALF